MPTLAQATSRSIEDLGYTRIQPASIAPARPPLPEPTQLQFMRSPLPPISTTPDSLRQFHTPGIPQMRIIPPASQSTGGGTGGGPASSGSTTVVVGSGGAGTGGSSTTVINTQSLKNASVTTPTLSQGQSSQIAVPMATVFALISVSVNKPARVRLYSTKAAQTADVNRSTSAPVVIGSESAIIADFLLLANTELNWTCSPALIGFNDDSTRVSTCYVTITNPNPSSATFTVSFTFAPLVA